MGNCRKLFRVRGSRLLAEREGGNKKGLVLENLVNTELNTQLATLHSFLFIEITYNMLIAGIVSPSGIRSTGAE